MKKIIYILILLVSTLSYSQVIFETDTKSQADYIVYVEGSFKSKADWVVLKTSWKNDAKDGKWYFTEWGSGADIKIFITDYRSEADKIVFYTDWTTDIKFKL